MDDLLKYLKILRRRWLPASLVFGAVFCLGYLRAAKEVPQYQAKGQLLVKQTNNSANSALQIYNAPLASTEKLANELVIIQSNLLAERVRASLKLEENSAALVEQLKVNNLQGTDILDFSYTSPDPRKAANILNAWMDNYIQLDRQDSLSESTALKKFLEQQIPKSQASLKLAAKKLKDFKQKNRVLDINAEASSTVSIISSLDAQVAATQAELAAQTSRLQSLQQILGVNSQEAIRANFINESPVAGSLLKQLQELKAQIDKERLRFGENHPQIVNLRQQETLLRQQLKDYMKTIFVGKNIRLPEFQDIDKIVQPGASQQELLQEYGEVERQTQSMRAQLQSLKQLIYTYRTRVNQLPELEFQQGQLERDMAAREEIFQNLVKNYQEVQLAINKQQGNVEVVQPALVPTAPMASRKSLYLLQGLLGGVILAWAVAMLLEKLDQTVKSSEEVIELLDYQVLGRIPNFAESKDRMQFSPVPVRDVPHVPASEAFRVLHTNLRFINSIEQKLQVIVVSSSVPGEGKSTIAANLAAVNSELGRRGRVLLIEADLRNPSQSRIWNLAKEGGVSALLQGESDVSELVIPVMSNLDVLVAGKIDSNPVALLGSNEMAALFKYGRENYDLVIVDSPPLTVAADTSILGKMADGILMVVRTGKVSSPALKSSKELLEQSGQKVLGLVFNFYSTKDSYGSYHSYYNYYGYGNGKSSETELKVEKV